MERESPPRVCYYTPLSASGVAIVGMWWRPLSLLALAACVLGSSLGLLSLWQRSLQLAIITRWHGSNGSAVEPHMSRTGAFPWVAPRPSAAQVQRVLSREGRYAGSDELAAHAETYAVTYAVIAELQRRGMHVCLHAGSHLGALRHHGIIPFEEKDVDLALFSTDHAQIEQALEAATAQFGLTVSDSGGKFGYQIGLLPGPSGGGRGSVSHYIDIWLFREARAWDWSPQVECVGWEHRHHGGNGFGGRNGCQAWFAENQARPVPVFAASDWLPFRAETFGTERVPIPATNRPIERFPFSAKDDWNKSCGPAAQREPCEALYPKHPFVFLLQNSGQEMLRRGSTVLHTLPGVA